MLNTSTYKKNISNQNETYSYANLNSTGVNNNSNTNQKFINATNQLGLKQNNQGKGKVPIGSSNGFGSGNNLKNVKKK